MRVAASLNEGLVGLHTTVRVVANLHESLIGLMDAVVLAALPRAHLLHQCLRPVAVMSTVQNRALQNSKRKEKETCHSAEELLIK